MSPIFGPDIRRALLWIPAIDLLPFPYGAFTLYGAAFQRTSGQEVRPDTGPNPTTAPALTGAFGLSCSLFDRLYSGNRDCFLFLRLLRCFSSPRHLPQRGSPEGQVVPLRNPGFNACMRLPQAYRSLPRPSSLSEPSRPPHNVAVLISRQLTYGYH